MIHFEKKYPNESKKEMISENACWTIVSVERAEYEFHDGMGSER